jgi:hypothetical protein
MSKRRELLADLGQAISQAKESYDRDVRLAFYDTAGKLLDALQQLEKPIQGNEHARKFEYATTVIDDEGRQKLELMNQQGADGWELVAVTSPSKESERYDHGFYPVAFFKRELR